MRQVKAPFLVYVLTDALANFDADEHPAVAAAVRRSIALWQRDDIGSLAWKESAAAAAGARTARSAATYDNYADHLLTLLAALEQSR